MSRTSKSLKNTKVALLFYFLGLALSFVSRKVFIDHLGIDVLGLNTTATNLLQFLNLAELGVGTAIASTLYKPLFDGHKTQICEIMSLQGWLYRRIAWIIIGGAAVLMCFFPLIFAKMTLPMWYAYGSFGVLLFSSLLSYFVNFRQILLSADQKEYKIAYSYRPVILLKVVCQIAAVKYLPNAYIWWLILEVLFAVAASWTLNRTIRKEYPYLQTNAVGSLLRKKYPDVITKVKQLFFHKVASFALMQTSTLIIYAYASLAMVAVYGNYLLIVTGLTTLLNAIFNSMNAGVGNLVAEGDKRQIIRIFRELFSSRFLFITTICFGVYLLTPQFITLWIGSEYLLDNTSLILIVGIMYIGLSRSVVDSYIAAYGLFRDIWAPITEATINIGLSILLGYFWGLHGILSGVLISLFLIIFCWKPYFLFKAGLHENLGVYIRMYTKHLCAATAVFVTARWISQSLMVEVAGNPIAFLLNCISVAGIFALLLTAILYASDSGFRGFVLRIAAITRNRKAA